MSKKIFLACFLSFCIAFANAQTPAAYWKLDESNGTTASDNSGNNYNGTLTGCTWKPTGGKQNGALSFNGTGDYVNAGTQPGSGNALTVAFWMNPSSIKHQIPLDKLPGTGTAGWSVKLRDNGDLWIRIGSEGNHQDIILLKAYQANAWTHLAFTYDQGTALVYLNGYNYATRNGITQTVNNATTTLRLGLPASGLEPYGGLLDEVRIYNTALPGAQIAGLANQAPAPSGDLTLWYPTQAGANFTDALAIGNGRLGGMVYGNLPEDRIGLNEGTVWSGGPGNNNKAGAATNLQTARDKLFNLDYQGACTAVNAMMGSGQASFQTVGNLYLNFPGHTASGYIRQLDLSTAIAKVTYTYNGVQYTREYFASFPDQTIVVRLTADQNGKITYTARMDTPQNTKTYSVAGNDVLLMDAGSGGIKFQARAKIKAEGGTLSSTANTITVTGANSSTIILAIGTNFNMYNDVNGDQATRAAQFITNAERKTFDQMKQDHIKSYQELFNRVDLDLGGSASSSSSPTDQRIANFNTTNDPKFVRLYYQFGRYLLISCSRPAAQAATLQGVWNDLMSPPWGSKYTDNINTEMNYWLAETTNLEECAYPLIDKVKNMVPQGKLTAQVHYNVNRGWVDHHNTDLWNQTAPIDGDWGFWPTGGAWLSKHLWEHYLFGLDKDYLTEVYPTIRGAAEFFLDNLVAEPLSGNNYLVTCPSTSPENTPPGMPCSVVFAPTMDNQIVRDILNHAIRASEILNVDSVLRVEMKNKVLRLPPHKIGKHGQLQEWFNDWDDPNSNHRHVSHLYGMFPSNQITMRGTPTLANAAKQTLIQRGDLSTGWSLAWKINLWARLEDGNHSYDLIRMLLTPERTYNNMFDAHPPFQIDGNFGATSGITEMLLQSQNNEIDILPALPTVWKTGSARGLRARNGFTMDTITWSNGKLTKVVISSKNGQTCSVRNKNKTNQFPTVKGTSYVLDSTLKVIKQYISASTCPGVQKGLQARYCNGKNFDTQMLNRIDSVIDYNWGQLSPDPLINIDNFSVRWTGQILPLYTEAYTFYINSDDGVRLWIDNKLVINNWIDHAPAENTGNVTLTAGKKHDIKVEYYESVGGCQMKLEWSSKSQARQVVPNNQLSPCTQTTPFTTGIADPESKWNVLVYPNPANEEVYIQSGELKIDRIYITDMLGKILYQDMSSFAGSKIISLRKMAIGIYFINLQSENVKIVRKLIVE